MRQIDKIGPLTLPVVKDISIVGDVVLLTTSRPFAA
jgi:hypothetical protein